MRKFIDAHPQCAQCGAVLRSLLELLNHSAECLT